MYYRPHNILKTRLGRHTKEMNNVMFALKQFVEHLVVKEKKKNVRKNNNNKRNGEQIVTKAIVKPNRRD